MHVLRITVTQQLSVVSVFVHIKYTYNMAACYDIDVYDITSPHFWLLW